jgi:2-methylfumaryl-CoA hydratase
VTRSDAARRIVPGAEDGWYLEDAVAGAVLRHPHGRTIGSGEHVWLAWVSDNASDLHGNADRASRGAFGGPIVLGALSVAIVAGLAEPAGGSPATWTVARLTGWHEIRLLRAVLPGDTLRAESTIVGLVGSPEALGGLVRRRVSGRDQRGDEVLTIDETCWAPRRDTLNKGLLTPVVPPGMVPPEGEAPG